MAATYLVYCPMNGRASIFVFDASSRLKKINDLCRTSTAVTISKAGLSCRGFDALQVFFDERAYKKHGESGLNEKCHSFLCMRVFGDVVFTDTAAYGEPCGMEWGKALSLSAMLNENRFQKEEAIKKAAEATADAIGEITDEVRLKWFVDYGTCNGWNEETRNKFRIANILHDKDKLAHPELHKESKIDTMRGWHETKCSCGFRHSCDSSD